MLYSTKIIKLALARSTSNSFRLSDRIDEFAVSRGSLKLLLTISQHILKVARMV